MGSSDSEREGGAKPSGVQRSPAPAPARLRESAVDLPEGHVLGERYTIVRRVGEGNMGVVYEAHDGSFDRRVAVKLLHPELILDGRITERFALEARTTGEVKHTNIVEVYEAASEHGRMYLVMEFLEGETLRDRIAAEAPMPPSRVVPVLERIASALAALHSRDIVHRDVKPENIYLSRGLEGELVPKLLDFGLAKTSQQGAERLTRTGTSMGTPVYMAPEQAHGARHVTGAADQYGLGVILYEALSGEHPHQGSNYYSLMLAKLSEPPLPLSELRPDLPEALLALVMRSIARDPAERFESTAAFRAALLPFASIDAPAPPRDPSKKRRVPARAEPADEDELNASLDLLPGAPGASAVAPPQPIEIKPVAPPPSEAASAPRAARDSATAAPRASRPSKLEPKAPLERDSAPSERTELLERPAGLPRVALFAVLGGVLLGVLVVVGAVLVKHRNNGHPPAASAAP